MKIIFTGDISITGSFIEKVNTNSEIFSKDILKELKSSNYTVGNLEGATTNTLPLKTSDTNTMLKSPVNTIKFLNKRNISVFNLANNHILDCGEKGLYDTLEKVKKENCHHFGAGLSTEESHKFHILKHKETSVALIGIAETNPISINNASVFSADDITKLKRQISRIKKEVDYVIINFHGGEEYTVYPSPVKRKLLKNIAKISGVDIVIAHHSHTLQGYEKVKDKYIFYSLGNFIFDIPNHKIHQHTNKSALLKFQFKKNAFTFYFIPFLIEEGKITSDKCPNFEKRILELSNFCNYKNKWRKEAFRVLFRNYNPKTKDIPENLTSLQNKTVFELLFSKIFYIKIQQVLQDKTMRSLYINAVLHKIITKINKLFLQ